MYVVIIPTPFLGLWFSGYFLYGTESRGGCGGGGEGRGCCYYALQDLTLLILKNVDRFFSLDSA